MGVFPEESPVVFHPLFFTDSTASLSQRKPAQTARFAPRSAWSCALLITSTPLARAPAMRLKTGWAWLPHFLLKMNSRFVLRFLTNQKRSFGGRLAVGVGCKLLEALGCGYIWL